MFKGLRQKGLVSDGVPPSLQHRASGKLAGQVRLYCVLNQDAARLARHGFEAEIRLVRRATEIERGRDAAAVVDGLIKHVDLVTTNFDELISKALASAALDTSVHDALLRVSERVDRARASSKALTSIQRTAFGRVIRIHGDLVDVLLEEGGRAIALDADTLAPHNLAWVGAPLALHWEKWSKGQAFFEAEPCIELGGDSATARQARFPCLRPPSPDDEVWDAVSAIAGAVNIGRDVAVARPK